MRRANAVVGFLCLLLIGGCADFKGTDLKAKRGTDHVRSENLEEFVSVQVQPTARSERYMIYFSWPRIEDQKRIRIRKDQTLALIPPTQTTFSHEVEHNQTLVYNFEILDLAGKTEKSFSKIVIVPRDFVVRAGQSEFTADQKLKIKRLFLNPDVPLRTNGFRMEIVADELIADKGLIESFAEGSKVDTSLNGKGAGELIIKAQTATGTLQIVMRGQMGGDGVKGIPYDTRAADGAPAGPGMSECTCQRCQFSQHNISSLSLELQPQYCICTKFGESGRDGAPGAKGRPGGRAGNGGDSGNLKVEIQEGSAFILDAQGEPGLAGIPGEGGDGQLGGIALENKDRCAGARGKNGPQGPKGDHGPVGLDGKRGLICIYIATEGKNDCY